MTRAEHVALIFVFATFACGKQRAEPRSWAVADTGAGPVVVGMSFDEANRAAGGILRMAQSLPTESCEYAWGPDSISFMIENGRLVRIDVRTPAIATSEGAKVGDAEARIEELYAGRVARMPHKYAQSSYYLAVATRETTRGTAQLIFETDGNVVTRFRGGLLPQVAYVEGCG